ncbi:hypothetical protein [Allobranchiibius huperziae]|uniref:Helix-turn-helix domain-containing protein n=1 Tax=Allobranchiibius huperziae TaxID=1874116 RepID=A0A853DNK7_9MICO|nr:hypothetical protein [Allobranchiibius huperziae]NYJ76584.1 hypothetical protein [Allobranchiibius huperziae]
MPALNREAPQHDSTPLDANPQTPERDTAPDRVPVAFVKVPALMLDGSLSAEAVAVWCLLSTHVRRGKRSVWPSQLNLARRLGRQGVDPARRVRDRLNELATAGWLVSRRTRVGNSTCNIYVLAAVETNYVQLASIVLDQLTKDLTPDDVLHLLRWQLLAGTSGTTRLPLSDYANRYNLRIRGAREARRRLLRAELLSVHERPGKPTETSISTVIHTPALNVRSPRHSTSGYPLPTPALNVRSPRHSTSGEVDTHEVDAFQPSRTDLTTARAQPGGADEIDHQDDVTESRDGVLRRVLDAAEQHGRRLTWTTRAALPVKLADLRAEGWTDEQLSEHLARSFAGARSTDATLSARLAELAAQTSPTHLARARHEADRAARAVRQSAQAAEDAAATPPPPGWRDAGTVRAAGAPRTRSGAAASRSDAPTCPYIPDTEKPPQKPAHEADPEQLSPKASHPLMTGPDTSTSWDRVPQLSDTGRAS